MVKEIYLKPTRNSKDITDEVDDRLYDLTYNGIMIYSDDESFPIPWDAGVYVEGSDLVLSGGAGPGGYGRCVVKVPVDRLPKSLKIFVEPVDDEAEKELKSIFTEYGWL